jgi:phosphate starvation-inducible PhoH-like protein
MARKASKAATSARAAYGFPKIQLISRSDEQSDLLRTVNSNVITFVKGPAGSGKTYLAVYYALQQLFRDKYHSVIFARPAIEADGEKLGYLPGRIREKIHPYMLPIFDAIEQLVGPEDAEQILHKENSDKLIKVIPLAFMRGLTFRNAICVVDEAQNVTPKQMRMILTRVGEGSRLIVVGDDRQPDIQVRNGLVDAFERLRDIEEIGFVTLTEESIVRHPLIKKIEARYEAGKKTNN